MSVDLTVVPGFLLLLAEFAALAAVGYVVARVALRQDDVPMALAQGLVIGLALWGPHHELRALRRPRACRRGHRLGPDPRAGGGPGVGARRRGFARRRACWRGSWRPSWRSLGSRWRVGNSSPFPIRSCTWEWPARSGAGGFPPELSWSPGEPMRYHHGAQLLIGLLAPPIGPDVAFAAEVLGAYAGPALRWWW